MENSENSQQVKIEHYTDDEFIRVTSEVLTELADDAEQIRKRNELRSILDAEKRIYELKRTAMKEYMERKQQQKLFVKEEENGWE